MSTRIDPPFPYCFLYSPNNLPVLLIGAKSESAANEKVHIKWSKQYLNGKANQISKKVSYFSLILPEFYFFNICSLNSNSVCLFLNREKNFLSI